MFWGIATFSHYTHTYLSARPPLAALTLSALLGLFLLLHLRGLALRDLLLVIVYKSGQRRHFTVKIHRGLTVCQCIRAVKIACISAVAYISCRKQNSSHMLVNSGCGLVCLLDLPNQQGNKWLSLSSFSYGLIVYLFKSVFQLCLFRFLVEYLQIRRILTFYSVNKYA